MSRDMTWTAPRAIDWERPGLATDEEVRENARALLAELEDARGAAATLARTYVEGLLESDDLPAMRHALNDSYWRLWR